MKKTFSHIAHNIINKEKWDALVDNDDNALAFCYSWYLDSFCMWDAIVLDDYCGAIALPTRRKFGLKQVYQPNFIQKCIWFGKTLNNDDEKQVRNIILNHYSLTTINTNILTSDSHKRTNLIISLSSNIDRLRGSYSKSLRKNLNRISSDLELTSVSEPIRTISLYRQQWGALNPQLINENYNTLSHLIKERPENFKCVEVTSDGELLAAIILLRGKNRFHYILGASSESGKKENALSLALDHIILSYAESDFIFDFEGSSIPSVKSFYESFGAIDEPFYEITLNSKVGAFIKSVYNRLSKS